MERRFSVRAIGVAWLFTIALDFFVFGGLFAGLFETSDPAVLSEQQLFQRIPAGYLTFLLEVGLLAWIFRYRRPATRSEGALLGVGLGAVLGAIFLLGTWSFSTIPLAILAVWFGTVVLQLAGAGAVLAAFGTDAWKSTRRGAFIGATLLIVGGIVLQNL